MSSIAEIHKFPMGNTKPEITLKIAGNTITSIDFKRPQLSTSQQKEYKGLVACHRVGLPILKQEIRNKYVGKTLQSKNPEGRMREIDVLGETIAHEWRLSCREPSNLFPGDPEHNEFSGKLCMLLQDYFLEGEDSFQEALRDSTSTPPSVSIPIPHGQQLGKNDRDGYKLVRDQLGTSTIELTSWEELCDWFFAVNYDESQNQQVKSCKSLLDVFRFQGTMAGTRKADQQYRQCQAMSRFKAAYQLEGLFQKRADCESDHSPHKRQRTETAP